MRRHSAQRFNVLLCGSLTLGCGQSHTPAPADTSANQQLHAVAVSRAAAPGDTTAVFVLDGSTRVFDLPGFFAVEAEPGSIQAGQSLTLIRTAASGRINDFEATALMRVLAQPEWLGIIVLGKTCPEARVGVRVHVPDQLRQSLSGRNAKIAAFAQMMQVSEHDVLDSVEGLPTARYDAATRVATFELPPEAFTAERSASRECEAVFRIAVVPGS